MKKNVLIIFAVLFVVFSISCKREDLPKVDDSSGLRLKTDNTAYIQGLITNGGTIVTIPTGTYYINQEVSVIPKTGMTLNLTGVTFQANISTSTNVTSVIKIDGKANVTINGGTIIGDRLLTTLGGNETAMGIFVSNSDYVTINGTTAKECKGDGFYVGYGSTSVTISSVIADHNRRQGLSVISVDGAVITNSTFRNTTGTAPEAGIDIEPNAGGTVNNVQITTCQTYGNDGSGVLVTIPNGGTITNVTLDGITSYSNLAGGFSLLNNISGVTVKNSTVYSNTGNGIAVWGNTSNNTIDNNKVYSNTVHGITLTNTSTNNTVTNNRVTNNSNRGICLYGVATGNSITGNTATGNPTGDILYYAGNTFSGNLTSAAPIAKYLMNSSSGTSVIDNSANGHTGTVYTTYAWGAGGITTPPRPNYLNALSLNSGDQNTGYVMVPDHAAFDFGTTNFSVSFWVKKNSTSGYAWGVDKWDLGASSTNEWAVSLSADGTNSVPRFTIATGSTNYGVTAGTTSILGAWHHVVGIRSDYRLYIFVDGVQKAYYDMPAGVSINNAGRNLYIGGAYSTGNRPNANFDNVRIYNYALTGTQVTELYNYTGNN